MRQIPSDDGDGTSNRFGSVESLVFSLLLDFQVSLRVTNRLEVMLTYFEEHHTRRTIA